MQEETTGTHLLPLCPGLHCSQSQGCPQPLPSSPSPTRPLVPYPHPRASGLLSKLQTLPPASSALPRAPGFLLPGAASASPASAFRALPEPLPLPERCWQVCTLGADLTSSLVSQRGGPGLALSWWNGNPLPLASPFLYLLPLSSWGTGRQHQLLTIYLRGVCFPEHSHPR